MIVLLNRNTLLEEISMKKSVIIALTIVMVSMFSVVGKAGVIFDGEYEYSVNSDGTLTLHGWYEDEETTEIPKEIDGEIITVIADGAFSECYDIVSIKIPDSIITIENNPFIDCQNLKQIIVSPDHETLAVLDNVLFNKKDKTLICYPCGLKEKEYSVPEGVQKIGNRAFYGGDNLLHIRIPDSVTTIGDGAFFYCINLRDVEIPDSVTTIGSNPFSGCYALTELTVSLGNETFEVVDDSLLDKKEKALICYPRGLSDNKYTIPDDVMIIGNRAFYGCDSLETVEIPDSVTSIGEEAFCDCEELSSIEILAGVQKIDNRAFSECEKLSRVELTEGLQVIGEEAFHDCEELSSIEIPASVTEIGNNAFDDNTLLIVDRDSYTAQYAEENSLPYTYPDSNDWLSDEPNETEEQIANDKSTISDAEILDLADKLNNAKITDNTLRKLNEDLLESVYYFEEGGILDSNTYMSEDATPDEICIVICKDDKTAEKAVELFEVRVKNQTELFASYNPDEVEKLEKAIIGRSENIAYLVIGDDYEQAEEILSDAGF